MFNLTKRNLIILLGLIILILVIFYQRDLRLIDSIKERNFFGIQERINEIKKGEEFRASSQLTRQDVMSYILGNISDLSPVKPVLGGKWLVARFWFATDRDLYVEYEDGHILRQILVKVEGNEEPLNYKVVGYFEPGKNGWNLKVGEDAMFGSSLDLYEWDEGNNDWAKKN